MKRNFMKRFAWKMCIAAILFAVAVTCLFVHAAAAEKTVQYLYVNSETGVDTDTGISADSAVKTFTRACRIAEASYADEVHIVFTNAYVFPSTVKEIEHEVPFVLTTKGEFTDFANEGASLSFKTSAGTGLRYYLNGETAFADIDILYSQYIVFVAQYHPIMFDEGVTTAPTDSSNDLGIYVLGGYQSPPDDTDTSLDSHITIKSGVFHIAVGGSRQKGEGASGTTYTGTNYINIEGGKLDIVLGGSYVNQISTSAVITVSGGEIGELCTGGDVTRRLEKDATVTLTGGSIDTLTVNNVVGAVDVTIAGAKIGKAQVNYANATIAEMARKTNAQKTLYYDAHYYSGAEAATLGAQFDRVVNITRVYAKADATGSGIREDDPASFADAFAKAAADHATVVVIGKIQLENFVEPTHAETVRVEGLNNQSVLLVHDYTLGGKTEFAGLEFGVYATAKDAGDGNVAKATEGLIHAESGKLCILSDVKITGNTAKILGSASLYAGTFESITGAGEVYIDGATVQTIEGGDDTAEIEVISGKVGTIRSTSTAIHDFALAVSGGEVGEVVFREIHGSLSYLLYGGTVGKYAVYGKNVPGKLTLGDGMTSASLGTAASLFTVAAEKVYFLRDGATGNGTSVTAAGGSLEDAYKAMANGGTIVLCGSYTLNAAFLAPEHSGKVTITSLYDGVDYRKEGAKLVLKGNLYAGGETEIDHIKLVNAASYKGIMAVYHDLTVGADVECGYEGNTSQYPSLVGGSGTTFENGSGTVTVGGGKWQRVRLGNSALTATNADLTMIFNGGEVVERVYIGSNTIHSGDLKLVINGGTFRAGISGIAMPVEPEGTAYSYTGNMTVELHGGRVYGTVTPRSTQNGRFNGTWNVALYGGDFAHLTDVSGKLSDKDKAVSTLYVSEGLDIHKTETGTYTFTNPIRSNGADPWIFYENGFYYYIATAGSQLSLYKAANIGDFPYVAGTVIYTPESGKAWSKNLWSPEIHYFTDAEVGAGNGGWYCFLGSDSGTDEGDEAGFGGQREYVIKCLDGDNLLGRWGNPVTGEVNVPQKVKFVDSDYNENELCGGIEVLKVNGKKYFLFVTEKGRGTQDFYQTINICEFENPWTIVGEPVPICFSEYDWEMHGSEDGVHPKVVEGGTSVYGSDGSVYIVYSGSGYWTRYYQLGYLKYNGGDPMQKSSWEKHPEPIFSQSAELTGCGHASYVTDTDGQGWICYHAYLGSDIAGGRYAFVEPYTADANGVVIGEGTLHPAAIDKMYTANVNPLPIAEKIVGFDRTASVASDRTVVELTIGKAVGKVNGEEKPLDAAPIIRNSRTMLPVRFLAEAFGAQVGWDGATSTATITADGVNIAITIGAATAQINGETVALDSPAFIENSRTYLPVRVIADALGAAVEWDGATSTATLTK